MKYIRLEDAINIANGNFQPDLAINMLCSLPKMDLN